ncbi:hypothetical protein C8R43DRAFT_951900 [Mycena crocata]|nr:hypothetical protein C8R43DRAFT_951900 [Mycena crocata]
MEPMFQEVRELENPAKLSGGKYGQTFRTITKGSGRKRQPYGSSTDRCRTVRANFRGHMLCERENRSHITEFSHGKTIWALTFICDDEHKLFTPQTGKLAIGIIILTVGKKLKALRPDLFLWKNLVFFPRIICGKKFPTEIDLIAAVRYSVRINHRVVFEFSQPMKALWQYESEVYPSSSVVIASFSTFKLVQAGDPTSTPIPSHATRTSTTVPSPTTSSSAAGLYRRQITSCSLVVYFSLPSSALLFYLGSLKSLKVEPLNSPLFTDLLCCPLYQG